MHRTTLGDFELTVVSDGTYFLDGGALFGVVPKTMWSKRVDARRAEPAHAGLNSLLVRTGDEEHPDRDRHRQQTAGEVGQIYKQPAKLLDNLHSRRSRAGGYRHRHQYAPAFRPLRMEHDAARRSGGSQRFRTRSITCRRQEWEHGRLQLERDAISYMSPNYDPLIESRADGVAERRSRALARHFGQESFLDTRRICRR